MAKFIYLYRGPATPMSDLTPEQGAERMAAFGAWMDKVGAAISVSLRERHCGRRLAPGRANDTALGRGLLSRRLLTRASSDRATGRWD